MLDGDCWLLDSGATCHFTYNAEMLVDIHEISGNCTVRLPNGKILPVMCSVSCHLADDLVLRDVLLVPEFKVNLISVSKIVMANDYTIIFSKSSCIIHDHSHKVLLKTNEPVDGLYNTRKKNQVHTFFVNSHISELELWHNRLGRAAYEIANSLLRSQNKVLHGIKFHRIICPLAKQCKLSFPLSTHVTTYILEIVHGEVWWPFHKETMSGCR